MTGGRWGCRDCGSVFDPEDAAVSLGDRYDPPEAICPDCGSPNIGNEFYCPCCEEALGDNQQEEHGYCYDCVEHVADVLIRLMQRAVDDGEMTQNEYEMACEVFIDG